MSNIKSVISVQDAMSPALMSMNNALNVVLNSFEAMQSASSQAINTESIQYARSELANAAVILNDCEDSMRQLNEEQDELNESIKTGSNSANGLWQNIKGIATAYIGIQSIKKALDLSDELSQTTARLNLMNDGLQSTSELQDKIFASAQRSRASYQSTADMVSKLGTQAKGAFSSNDELIAFTEQLNKNFAIAGTSQQGIASAQLQLTQALASGVLRGEELNSVYENATPIIQKIADYLDVDIGQIRTLASEGKLSAQVVKNALLSTADETNEAFESMPKTWSQIWTSMSNVALMKFQPILNKLNEIANSEQFQTVMNGIIGSLSVVANVASVAFDILVNIASFIVDNWSVIAPIILGVAAALLVYKIATSGVALATKGVALATKVWENAQKALNTVMSMNPVMLIVIGIILLIALIYAVVGAINKVTGSSISATGIIVGVLTTAVAIIYNLFLGLLDLVLGIINALVNSWIAWANFFANLFNDPIASIIHLFGDFADNILGIIETIAKALDKVFGSNLAGAVQGWRSNLSSMVETAANTYGNGSYEKVAEELNLSSESLGLSRWAYSDAYNTGYNWGQGIETKVSNLFGGNDDLSKILDGLDIPSNLSDISGNTSSAAKSLEVEEDILEYMRDVAEQEAVNRFTTAEIKVEMTNNNNVNNGMDLDGMVEELGDKLEEKMFEVAEGVHV